MVDRWFKCEDMESFKYARMLIKEEGMLCGEGSGGRGGVEEGGRGGKGGGRITSPSCMPGCSLRKRAYSAVREEGRGRMLETKIMGGTVDSSFRLLAILLLIDKLARLLTVEAVTYTTPDHPFRMPEPAEKTHFIC